MFLLEIEDLILEQMALLASSSTVPIKTVARLALIKGMAELESLEPKTIAQIKQSFDQELREESRFIVNNWQTMTDREMAEKLNTKISVVAATRRGLAMLRKRGAPTKQKMCAKQLNEEQIRIVQEQMATKSDRTLANELICTVSAVKAIRKQLAREFIQTNWPMMNDGELCAKLGMSLKIVFGLRTNLGIKRRRKETKTAKVDIDILRRELLQEGETQKSFCVKHGVDVTRQYISWLCMEHTINIKNRTPMWFVKKNQKRFPVLADKEKLTVLMNEYRSIFSMAAHLDISAELLKKAMLAHEIDYQQLLREPIHLIELTCTNPDCHLPNGKFFRKKNQDDRSREKKPAYAPYCSRKCFGHCMGLKNRRRNLLIN